MRFISIIRRINEFLNHNVQDASSTAQQNGGDSQTNQTNDEIITVSSGGNMQNADESQLNHRPRRRRRRTRRHMSLTRRISQFLMSNTLNTFRYGLVLLYIGTLLIVIGYHNPWVEISRYFGIILVAVGMIFVWISSVNGVRKFIRRQRDGNSNEDGSNQERSQSSNSKQGLPTYETAIEAGLPTYEEATALRQTTKKWLKRHSVAVVPLTESHAPEAINDVSVCHSTLVTISDQVEAEELPPPPYLVGRSLPLPQTPPNSTGSSRGDSSIHSSTSRDIVINRPIETMTNLATCRSINGMSLMSVRTNENCSNNSDSEPNDICIEEMYDEDESPSKSPLNNRNSRSAVTERLQEVASVFQIRPSRPQTSATVFLESCNCSLYEDSSFESITSSEDSGDWDADLENSYDRQPSSRSENLVARKFKTVKGPAKATRRFSDGTNTPVTVTDLES